MGLSRLALLAVAVGAPIFADFPPNLGGQIRFLLHRGKVAQAFGSYLDYARESESHDFSLLQQAGISLLERGALDEDPEIQLMCMFGAGVATVGDLIPVLEKGIQSPHEKIQLVALGYLSKLQDDRADRLIVEALSSPFLLTRLEACFQLAQKNHPEVLTHLRSLDVKIPPPLRALFPQIVVFLDSPEAKSYLRQMLSDSDIGVRLEAIACLTERKRDDFLPQLRLLASGVHHTQQERCAAALGELRDRQSLPHLKKLLESPRPLVKLAAAVSLVQLGEKDSLEFIEAEALQGNLFAIAALGKLGEGKRVLRKLIRIGDRDVRLNATLSLLLCKESASVDEILFEETQGAGFTLIHTPGRALSAWKILPLASQHQERDRPGVLQETHQLRQKVLRATLELPDETFYRVAESILGSNQSDLVPPLMALLENKRTERAIALLKKGAESAGEPLVRNYCTLALYNLGEGGSYEGRLLDWVRQAGSHPIIRFQESKAKSTELSRYELTPTETSQFLVEVFEALARKQNQVGVEALIHAIAHGNSKNRYALAGLLIRTTE